jgi:hypothetical protein
VRMPSFWESDGAEPGEVTALTEYFIADAAQKPFGFQPVAPLSAVDRKLYDAGKRLVMAKESEGGAGCFECHSVGRKIQPEPKWASNLIDVRRRLKEDWVRRLLVNPGSLYPWTNMPCNFQLDWDAYNRKLDDPLRGLCNGDAEKFKVNAEKLNAALFFLYHAGDEELGKTESQKGADGR